MTRLLLAAALTASLLQPLCPLPVRAQEAPLEPEPPTIIGEPYNCTVDEASGECVPDAPVDEVGELELSEGGLVIEPVVPLPPPPQRTYLGQFTVTAYACPPYCGRTASGAQVGPGSIASDWRVVPPGTHLEMPGYAGVVVDTGGAIYGQRLDVWHHALALAFAWGRRVLPVWRVEAP